MSTEQNYPTKDIPAEVKDLPKLDTSPATADNNDSIGSGPLSVDYVRKNKFPGESPAGPAGNNPGR